jgi:hypothetical protein
MSREFSSPSPRLPVILSSVSYPRFTFQNAGHGIGA